jgi:flagellar motor switch protein FliM
VGSPALSQSDIDNLLTGMRSTPTTVPTEPFDFRTPGRLAPSLVAQVQEIHKVFTRSLSVRLGRELRLPVLIEPLATDQLTYDAYIRAIPNPNLLTLFSTPPHSGKAVLEVSPQLAMSLVDILMGGSGRPIAPRTPTDLEMVMFGDLLEHFTGALDEAFSGVGSQMSVLATELNPQFLQAAAATESVLALSYSVTVEGPTPTAGLVAVCYPVQLLEEIEIHLRRPRWSETAETAGAMDHTVAAVPIELALRTRPSSIRAADLVGLAPGDVIALDQGEWEPWLLTVEGLPILSASPGIQHQRLAARIQDWLL